MSVNKMGSKLAQGVRQVMGKQIKSLAVAKKPELAQQKAVPRVAAGKAPSASVKKATSAQVANKTQIAQKIAEYEILHPSRVWPD